MHALYTKAKRLFFSCGIILHIDLLVVHLGLRNSLLVNLYLCFTTLCLPHKVMKKCHVKDI